MRRLLLIALGGAIVLVSGVAAAPTAQCQGDCPAYNSRCISDLGCKPLQCGMHCVDVNYQRRCR